MQFAEHRGKQVILLMIVVALAMAGYAWWHQRQAGRRSTGFWGTESAIAVRYAPRVEFVPLRPLNESAEEVEGNKSQGNSDTSGTTQTICGGEYVVGDPVDVTRTRGLVHARHALVDDHTYDWNARPTQNPRWEFLLRFHKQNQVVTAAFDTEHGVICHLEQSRTNELIPKIAAAFAQKRDEWMKGAENRERRAASQK